ncbi:DUF2935 domain-containing protein [Paenibacillus oenotherae]|uniref:superoxide dismutase n=1 Tax=Paenibacillus oenotherae TaxID=1435645 RepID=A0ABS7D4Q0_9BACL|nr:DUF2935 domain-containing protein [Paenibacillus oenotherae]
MLLVYGPYMPLRVLEEICFWKMQEMEHTVVIRQIVPNLEQPYVELLKAWEPLFARTEKITQRLLQTALICPTDLSPAIAKQTDTLLQVSALQSRTFVAQLTQLLTISAAVAASPIAVTVINHIIRESDYFLCVLATLLHPHQAHGDGLTEREPELSTTGEALSPTIGDALFPADEAPSAADSIPSPPSSESDIERDSPAKDSPLNENNEAGAETIEPPLDDRMRPASVPIGGHTLPPLPYPYNALEPHIDEATMRIHHDKHHQSYVDGLNRAEKELEKARQQNDFDLIKHWERELAFNGAGHYLHSIFWNIMSPHGGGPATGPIARQIERDFGSYEAFKKQFSAAAEKVEGGGWAILVWSPRSRRLEILTAEKHQNLSQWDIIPLLPLDVWEHAYYLKHQNKRADYIKDWWNVVYWPGVNDRFTEASKLVWEPY